MPVLREQLTSPSYEPILRLTAPLELEDEPSLPRTEDAMSVALGLKVSASVYEVWRSADLWHMAGGARHPMSVVAAKFGREVSGREFTLAVVGSVNAMIGFDGCRPLGKDRIRADGSDTVSLIVDRLLNKRQGKQVLSGVLARLKGE